MELSRNEFCVIYDMVDGDAFAESQFIKLKSELSNFCDVFAAIHCLYNDEGNVRQDDRIRLTSNDILFNFNHMKDVSRGIIPGNPDLKLIRAVQEVGSYNFYVRIEFDVMCTQPTEQTFRLLFDYIKQADFCASYVHEFVEDDWMWGRTLAAPPNAALDLDGIKTRAFLPLMSMSSHFIDRYTKDIRDGWRGHYEVLIPSLAKLHGLKILDLSTFDPPFTRFPQFSVEPVSHLEDIVPLFVHPVKSSEEKNRIVKAIQIKKTQ